MSNEQATPGATVRRLIGYALLFRKKLAIAFIILLLSVAAQLSGPYIVKIIIDQHIQGIVSYAWYEIDGQSNEWQPFKHTAYGGNVYIRSDRIAAQHIHPDWGKAKIEQKDEHYNLTSPLLGTVQLTADEVRQFYEHDFAPVIRLIMLYLVLLFVGGYLSYAQGYLLQVAALHIIRKLRTDIMAHIHRLPVRYFDNTPAGQIVTRLANDTEAIKELFMSFMATFVVSGAHLLGVFILLFVLDYRLALWCLLILPLFYIIMKCHLRFSQKYVERMRARLSDMNAMLNEAIAVMPIIKAFRREKGIIAEFEQLNEDRYVNQIKQFRLWAASSRNITSFIGSMTVTLIIWYFAGQSLQTAISFGVAYAFIDYISRIFEPIIAIFDQLMNAQRAVVSAERVFNLLDEEGLPPEPHEHTVPRPAGHVVFDGVTFSYNGDEDVLKNVSFEVKEGETIAIVGHTGSGKSSLMNLLLGFYKPQKGTITIDGRDIHTMPKQALRQHMGIVLQDPFLFAGDIKFNVRLYNEQISLQQVKDALREVGAEDFIVRLPDRYDEQVVEKGSTLSAGQRQLISFARALAYDPAILILDEATSSIDSETESIIQNALNVLVKGRTTFIIAHRLSTIRQADQIIVMHKGKIVERGNHEQLMALGKRYYTMVQLQQQTV